MENLLKKIEDLRERFLTAKKLQDIDRLTEKSHEKKTLMNSPDFWNDREAAVLVGQEVEELDNEINKWVDFEKEIRELEELVALSEKDKDLSLNEEAEIKFADLTKKLESLEFLMLLSEKYDDHNAIVSVHAGTGGVDAQDFAEMLERMLLRYAEKRKFKIEIIDRNLANEAGIKSSSFRVIGRYAFGYLQSENGVHRLVRISPFDAESMRHTSFALVEVIPELPEAEDIIIKDEDLKMDFFHSSGPGGQNVNKTSSAVRLTHIPTKTIVTCQSERSQHQNREIAMRVLKSKLKLLEENKRGVEEKKLKGEPKTAFWGRQIRSYVLQPYQMVKDHRSDFETSAVTRVLDGELADFSEAYLRWRKGQGNK